MPLLHSSSNSSQFPNSCFQPSLPVLSLSPVLSVFFPAASVFRIPVRYFVSYPGQVLCFVSRSGTVFRIPVRYCVSDPGQYCFVSRSGTVFRIPVSTVFRIPVRYCVSYPGQYYVSYPGQYCVSYPGQVLCFWSRSVLFRVPVRYCVSYPGQVLCFVSRSVLCFVSRSGTDGWERASLQLHHRENLNVSDTALVVCCWVRSVVCKVSVNCSMFPDFWNCIAFGRFAHFARLSFW
jgi:hypothetical protein